MHLRRHEKMLQRLPSTKAVEGFSVSVRDRPGVNRLMSMTPAAFRRLCPPLEYYSPAATVSLELGLLTASQALHLCSDVDEMVWARFLHRPSTDRTTRTNGKRARASSEPLVNRAAMLLSGTPKCPGEHSFRERFLLVMAPVWARRFRSPITALVGRSLATTGSRFSTPCSGYSTDLMSAMA